MFNFDDILKAKQEQGKQKTEMFMNLLRKDMLEYTEEKVSEIYSRDKHKSLFGLFKMKSGNFNILDTDKNILFQSKNLHEAKVEFIIMSSATDGGMGSKIFEKACGL